MIMTNDEIAKLGVVECLNGLKNKKFSAVENVKAFAEKVKENKYNAFITPTIDYALSRAKMVDNGEITGRLAGVVFGVKDVSFDPDTNEYYSKANKAFVLGEIPATTLYYYPVYMESIGVEEVYGSNLQPSNGTSIAEGEEKGNEKYTKVTVDSIFISDDLDMETIESAKYAGKYDEKNVDSNVKFVFNAKGKLVAYQYN